MSYFFNGNVTGGQRGNRVLDRFGRALNQHEHRAHGHALDIFNAGLHQAHVQRELLGQIGQERARRIRAGQGQAQEAHGLGGRGGNQRGDAFFHGRQGGVGQVGCGGG
ncbi:hypothetical protein D3C71_1635190 [compost metagenome]